MRCSLFLRRLHPQKLWFIKIALTMSLPISIHAISLTSQHLLFEVLPTYSSEQIFKGSSQVGRTNLLFAFTFWRDFWVENKANKMQGCEFQKLRLKRICSLHPSWSGLREERLVLISERKLVSMASTGHGLFTEFLGGTAVPNSQIPNICQ